MGIFKRGKYISDYEVLPSILNELAVVSASILNIEANKIRETENFIKRKEIIKTLQ